MEFGIVPIALSRFLPITLFPYIPIPLYPYILISGDPYILISLFPYPAISYIALLTNYGIPSSMNRRTAFKNLAMASVAAWLLPSCVSDPKKVSIALNRLQVTGDEEALLMRIADAMIPETDTPGAVAVKAHLFALVMVDDCMSQKDREQYLKGMRSFEKELKDLTGKEFGEASADERLEMLTAFEAQLKESNDHTRFFYSKTRGYILQGYTSSQHFLTDINPYELVPGPNYRGCVPLSPESKTLS